MERTLLTWSVENWITVLIMAALGYMVAALVWQFIQKFAPAGAFNMGS